MSIPLGQRLSDRAEETFVGRDSELAALRQLQGDDGPLVVFIHGIAGQGKSTLISNFSDIARKEGVVVIEMDCRLIEPTERGFLNELAHLLEQSLADFEQAIKALNSYSDRVFISLDHYEAFGLMDTWIRQTLLPALPENFRLILSSRQPPVPIWVTSPRWHGLFKAIALNPLDQTAALELLNQSGIKGVQADQIVAMTHGNPLALKLAAATASSHLSLRLEDTSIHEVMEVLAEINLEDVDDPDTRKALQLASVVRRITRSLLRVLITDGEKQWDELRKLAFIDSRRDGLRIHDTVREAIAQTLHASDPEAYLNSRRCVWQQLREELKAAPRSELWRYTADMLYLAENPVVREAFFPSGHQEFAIEPAQPDDFESILNITRKHEGAESTKALEAWWESMPQAFQVARNSEGRVVAFYCMCEAAVLPSILCDADPIAAVWQEHLTANPLAESNRALLLRRWIGEDSGEAPSPEQAACWLDVKRTYMSLRPELRRVYLTVIDLPTYAPVAIQLGFEHIADATCELDGVAYQTALLDFGPDSVDGWVAGLVGAEMGITQSSIIDHQLRSLDFNGEKIPLTRLEYRLISYLEELNGATASRDQIHNEVWGTEIFDTSSNVIDAVVKSLRKKLGNQAGMIETVRGHGYRLRSQE
ncbi:MAG: winged helix-turn-helix domain-containing protein [Neptuniibacter sp.]